MYSGAAQLIRETYLDVEREYLYWREDTARQVCVRIGTGRLIPTGPLNSVVLDFMRGIHILCQWRP